MDESQQLPAGAWRRCMMEAKKGIGQKFIKGGMNDCLPFDIWFAYKKAA